jgi:hypothetical protein
MLPPTLDGRSPECAMGAKMDAHDLESDLCEEDAVRLVVFKSR